MNYLTHHIKNSITLFVFLFFSVVITFAQVTIGSSYVANKGAILDLKQTLGGSSSKGLSMPRVNLRQTSSLFPCADQSLAKAHTGLIVYNVATINDVCPGLYVWDGSLWQAFQGECDLFFRLNHSSISLNKGDVLNLEVEIYQGDNVARTYTWQSSNVSVATVNNMGVVTTVGEGNTTITVTSNDGLTATCLVIVMNDALNNGKIRFYLTDKGSTNSKSQAAQFLTQRSIDRRLRQGIDINYSDLPISKNYRQQISATGGIIVAQSKWMQTIVVHCTSNQMINDILALPFIQKGEMVWIDTKASGRSIPQPKTGGIQTFANSANYGSSWDNIHTNQGEALHDAGYKGAGMEIAVIDAGFDNVSAIALSYNMNIKGAKSMIYNSPSTTDAGVYGNHGMWVLSCMAANKTGSFIGTAPEASYWLFRVEDSKGIAPIQEDYWIAAAEYADSVGVDIINTSLGYKTGYQAPFLNYTYNQTDGKSIYLSRGANIAVEKGIFVVASAGNDQNWVSTPGEAKNVLTVGEIQTNGNIYTDSSKGTTYDGRMKPEVVALGQNAVVVNPNGSTTNLSGTSFSTPILSGMIACLWQAFPTLTNEEIKQAIIESANRYTAPILPFGYGAPDMSIAMQKAQLILDAK